MAYTISIHTLVKRVTKIANQIYNNEIISIHTLVKRVTIKYSKINFTTINFNSHSRKESDLLK